MDQALYPYIAVEDRLRLTEVCRAWRHTFKHALHLVRVCDRINFSKIWSLPDIAESWEDAMHSKGKWVHHRYRRYWHKGKRSTVFPRSVEALIPAGN